MSKTVDERVVEMRFDNEQFESGVKTSLSTLDRLKESLNFLSGGNALADLGNATTNISGMGTAVDTVKSKFSILETVATGALLKIGSAAADAGMKILNQVNPLNQVTAGWDKYGEKTTAVQTIMAATRDTWESSAEALGYEGDQMGFVSEQLDKLNWFTDETSYGFTDMVTNIGKFTNNNIPLEQAVTSMEGIATWAGISGANVSDASRAMYNFSQAMGAGAMKLQDWKSIENANMATTEFKQAAIDTAIELGRLKEVEEGVYIATEQWGQMKPDTFTIESFSTQLKDLWMNKDVMTATLEKFGGFTDELNKFYGLVGDNYDTTSALLDDLDKYKELSGDTAAQTEMLNEISEATGITVEDLRKEFDLLNSDEYDLGKRAFRAAQEAKTFKEAIDSVADASSTAWMKVFEAIFGNYEQAKTLWTGLANGLWDIFVGPVDQLASVMQIWNELGGRDDLLAGFSALGDAAGEVFGSIKEGFESVFGERDDNAAAQSLKDLTERFKNFAESIKPSEETLNRIKTVATTVATVLQKLGGVVGKIGSFFLGAVKDILTFITTNERIQKLVDAIGKAFLNFGDQIQKLVKKFQLFTNLVKQGDGFKKFADLIDRIKKSIGDFVGAGVDKVIDFFEKLSNLNVDKLRVNNLAKQFRDFLGVVTDKVDGAREKITNFFNSFKEGTFLTTLSDTFTNIKTAVTDLAGAAWGKVTDVFGKLFNKGEGKEASMFGDAFSGIGEKIGTALGKAGEYLGKFRDKVVEFLTPAKEFVQSKFHEAVEKIGDAFEKLKGKNPAEVFTELTDMFKETPIVGKGMELFGSFMEKVEPIFTTIKTKIADFINGVKTAFQEGGIGAAIEKVLEPIKKLKDTVVDFVKNIDINNPFKSISDFFKNLGGSIGSIGSGVVDKISSIFSAILKFVKGITPEKVMQIGGFAASLASLIAAIKMMTGIGKATTSFSELLDALKDNVVGKENKLRDAAILIGVIAGALVSLAGSVKILGSMKTGDLAKGELAIAGIAAIVIAFEKLSQNAKDINVGAIVVFTGAIVVLCNQIKKLSEIPWDELIPATAALDSVILSLGGSLKLMSGFQGMSFGAFLEAVIMLGGVVLALKFLTDGTSDFDGMLKASESLSLLLVSLGGTLALISTFASNIGAAVAAIGAFDLFIIDLGVLLYGMGRLASDPEIQKAIGDGGETLAKIGYAIGDFVGSIIGGFAGGASSGLPEIGTNLSSFMENASTFFDKLSETDFAGASTGLLNLTSALKQVTSNAIWDDIRAVFHHGESSMDTLGEDLSKFADAVIGYVQKMNAAKITDEAISNSTKAAEALIAIKNALPAENGVLQLFAGFKNWKAFVHGIEQFADGIVAFGQRPWENINLDRIDAAKGVVEQMVAIKALLPDEGGVLQFFSGTGKWDKFSKGLIDFADAIIGFANKDWGNVDLTVLEGISTAVGHLATLKNAFPKEGGLVDFFSGAKKWSYFSEGLGGFGEAIIKFAKLGWSENMKTAIDIGVECAGKLVKIKKKIPDEGFLSSFEIFNTWSTFSTGLENFGKAVHSFAVIGWGDVSKENMDNAKVAVEALVGIKKFIGDDGENTIGTAFLQWFTGFSEWETFSKGLESFATAIGAYNDVVAAESFDAEAITASVEAATALAGLGSLVGEKETGVLGAVVNFFVGGEISYDKFKENLVKFAEALKGYADAIKGLDVTSMSNSATAAQALVDMMTVIQSGDLSTDMGETLAQFGENLLTFAGKLQTYGTIAKGLDWTSIETSTTKVKELVDLITSLVGLDISGTEQLSSALENLANTSIQSFADAFTNSTETVNGAIDTMVGYAIAELAVKAPEFLPTGQASMDQFITGVASKQVEVNTQMQTVATEANAALLAQVMADTFASSGRMADAQMALGIASEVGVVLSAVQILCSVAYTQALTLYSQMYQAGAYAGQGLADGLRSQIDNVSSAASDLSNAASVSVTTDLDEASPSKLWKKFGAWAGEGLAIGIENSTGRVTDAATNMATETSNVVSEAISSIKSDDLFGDDYEPTITPVLDLSNIEEGSDLMRGLLDQNAFVDPSVTSGLYARTRNPNADVIAAINGMSGSRGDTYGETTINVYAQPGMDANQIADITLKKLNNQINRRKAAYA